MQGKQRCNKKIVPQNSKQSFRTFVQLSAGVAERLYRLAVGRAAGRGRRALRLGTRVDPTAVHPAVERVRCLGVNVSLPHEATEGRLDVAGRTAEPVVKVEMAKRGIEIIAPKQADHAPTQPQAFRIGGGPSQEPLGFGELVDFLLGFLGVAGRRLIRGLLVRILSKCRVDDKQHHRAHGGGEKTHPQAVHGCPDMLDYGGRLGPSHADPFGQHCGSGRSPWCNPIKAVAWRAAKMAKRRAGAKSPRPYRPPVAWHRPSGTISEAPSSRRAGRDQAQWVLRPRFSRLRLRRSPRHGHGSGPRFKCRRPRWRQARSFIASPTPRFGGRRARSGPILRSIRGKSTRTWLNSSKSPTACAPTRSITGSTRSPNSPSVTG